MVIQWRYNGDIMVMYWVYSDNPKYQWIGQGKITGTTGFPIKYGVFLKNLPLTNPLKIELAENPVIWF